MARSRIFVSVVTGLVASLVIGGAVLLTSLALLDLSRAKAMLRMNLARDGAQAARDVQDVMSGTLGSQSPREIEAVLGIIASNRHIRALRLSTPGIDAVHVGDWPENLDEANRWELGDGAASQAKEVGLDRMTLVSAACTLQGRHAALEMVIDGPGALRQSRGLAYEQIRSQGLLLALMTLLGLLLVRRWIAGPLSDTMDLVKSSAGAERFYDLAREQRGEFGLLAEAVGGMLTRLDCTTQQLRQRERALDDLYQLAPAAMISLDAAGKIVEANRRAAQLLGVGVPGDLTGRTASELVCPEDRALLGQTIERLDQGAASRCQMRLLGGGLPARRPIDVIAECTGLCDEDGVLRRVRLALLDISQATLLQRQLADKTRLLNLVFDHMSDAIVLVDNQGRVAAANQTLLTLLRQRSDQVIGRPYDPERFWDELGVSNPEVFAARLRQIDADRGRPARERFEARAGTFQFQGIPMHDATGTVVGRLWVVQEITPQERAQRLLEQQSLQLQAMRKLGQQLGDVAGVDELMERAAAYVYDAFSVEAIGLAIRADRRGQRSRQLLHRGSGGYPLAFNRTVVQAVEKHLMPATLAGQDVLFWAELPSTLPWARTFNQAGLTCVASAPLRGNADAQGIVWIARRGGERLERHHIHMLEAMAPIIASRLEFAQLRESMRLFEVTDPVTDLANRGQFERMAARLQNRPGYPWSVVMVKLDRFHRFNDTLGHAVADRLLRDAATTIREAVRKSCFVARLDGTLFGVLCPDTPRAQALRVGERLAQAIRSLPVAQPADGADRVTASIGLASSPEDGHAGATLTELALARVEIAKRTGRDRCVCQDVVGERRAG